MEQRFMKIGRYIINLNSIMYIEIDDDDADYPVTLHFDTDYDHGIMLSERDADNFLAAIERIGYYAA